MEEAEPSVSRLLVFIRTVLAPEVHTGSMFMGRLLAGLSWRLISHLMEALERAMEVPRKYHGSPMRAHGNRMEAP